MKLQNHYKAGPSNQLSHSSFVVDNPMQDNPILIS